MAVVALLGALLAILPLPSGAPAAVQPVAEAQTTSALESGDWFPAIGTFQLWCTMGNPGCSGYHSYPAMDIGMPVGTAIYAAGPGTVSIAAGGCYAGDSSCNGAAGNYVAIKHPDGRTSRYLHLSVINVTAGQAVVRGQLLGQSGMTGRTTGPHLHYDEQNASGTYVDPGPMWARKGGATVQYPNDLGYTSWWSVPAFSTYLQNDGYVRSASFGDFDGNGRADLATFEPATGMWRAPGAADVGFGGPGQVPVPGEYNGDGKTERATYEPATGTWRVAGQPDLVLGGPGQVPVQADYSGAGQWEAGVYDQSTGVWKIQGLPDRTLGGPGQLPVPADYDASGKAEPATYEPTTGIWRFVDGTSTTWGGSGQLPVPGDYTGDGRAEAATYNPATGVWKIKGLPDVTLGGPGQVPVPADFSGSGKVVPATYEPATGTWRVLGQAATVAGGPGRIPVASMWPALEWRLMSGGSALTDFAGELRGKTPLWRSSNGAWLGTGLPSYSFGLAGDVPLVGDFDGDTRAESAVYRPANGVWFVNAANWWPFQLTTPQAGDVPLVADFDGTGRARPAIYRPSTGEWFRVGTPTTVWGGQPGDVPVAVDVNGDGKAEIGVWRAGQWLFPGQPAVAWGLPGDVPVVADADGDGRDDLIVYRPSDSTFWVRLSGWTAIQVGQPGDTPFAGDLNGDSRADLATFRPTTGQVFVSGGVATTVGAAGDVVVPLGTRTGVRPPAPPTGVSAVSGTQAALVSWTAPDDNGGAPIVGYRVTATPGGGTVDVDGPGTTALVPNLDLGTSYSFTVSARNAAGVGDASVPSGRVTSALPPVTGFHPLPPARVLDTRPGTSTGLAGAFGPTTTRQLTVAGAGGVPATGASAVMLNVTVTGASAPSFLTVWPGGQPKPMASNLNFGAGQTVANLVVAGVDANGTVNLYNSSGTVDVIADVVGWFDVDASGDRFTGLTPARILDTRDGTGNLGGTGSSADATSASTSTTTTSTAPPTTTTTAPSSSTSSVPPTTSTTSTTAPSTTTTTAPAGAPAAGPVPLGPGESRQLTVIGTGGVPTSASAVVLNVTATGGSAPSHLTVWPAGQAKPVASNLNFNAGQTVPNLVVVPVGANGRVSVFNNAGSVNVIADVVGFFAPSSAAGGFVSTTPARILDTRDGTGGFTTRFGPGQARSVKVTGVGGLNGVPATGVSAVVLNVTVTGPTAPSFLTVWPSGVTMPTTSNLNFVAGQTVPNLVMARVGPDGKVSIFNNSGNVDVIADVVGWYASS
ncbi:MAG: peptidoglycan DD-metalloendopeptidase family protein [Acidimicrobiales bacterium]